MLSIPRAAHPRWWLPPGPAEPAPPCAPACGVLPAGGPWGHAGLGGGSACLPCTKPVLRGCWGGFWPCPGLPTALLSPRQGDLPPECQQGAEHCGDIWQLLRSPHPGWGRRSPCRKFGCLLTEKNGEIPCSVLMQMRAGAGDPLPKKPSPSPSPPPVLRGSPCHHLPGHQLSAVASGTCPPPGDVPATGAWLRPQGSP